MLQAELAGKKREYDRQRKASAILLYFRDPEEKAEFVRMSRAEGERVFSRWVIQKLLVAMSGNVYAPGFVDQLQKDIAKYREWLASRDAQIAELRKDLRAAELEREDLRVVVAAFGADPNKVVRRSSE